jgi:hypothetical protein
LIEVLDPARIFPHHYRRKVFDCTHHRSSFPLQRSLAPPEEPWLIGLDFAEYPIPHLSIDDYRLQSGDFHTGY